MMNLTTAIIDPDDSVVLTVKIKEQIRVGQHLYVSGVFSGSPEKATIELPVADISNGGVSVGPTTIMLDKINKVFAVTLAKIPPGSYDVPILNFTDVAGTVVYRGIEPVVINDPNPVPVAGTIIKTIGKGKDYPTLAAFAVWLNSQDLVLNNMMVYGYVYDDFSNPNVALLPMNADTTRYCIVKPAPGLSVNELEIPDSPVDYGRFGIQLTLSIHQGIQLGAGVELSGFRIYVPSNFGRSNGVTPNCAILMSRHTQSLNISMSQSWLRNNRFLMEHNTFAAVRTDNALMSAQIEDNIFIHSFGHGLSINACGPNRVCRNDFIRRKSAMHKTVVENSLYALGVFTDNVAINAGPQAFNYITKPTESINNVSNVIPDPPHVGVVGITDQDLVVSLYDLRPTVNSPLIDTGSSTAEFTKDVRGRERGEFPDLGAVQLTTVFGLTDAIITAIVVEGSKLTYSGITRRNPTSATAYLPNDSDVVYATNIALEDDKFIVEWEDLPPGNYGAACITFDNAGGTSAPLRDGIPFIIEPTITVEVEKNENKIRVITATGNIILSVDKK